MEGVNRVEDSNLALADVVARLIKAHADVPTHAKGQLMNHIGEEGTQKLHEAFQTITSETALQQFMDKVCEELFTQLVSGEQIQELQNLFEYLQIIPPEHLIKGKVGGVEGLINFSAKTLEATDKFCDVFCQGFEEALKELNSNSEKLKVEMGEEAFQTWSANLNKCLEDARKLKLDP